MQATCVCFSTKCNLYPVQWILHYTGGGGSTHYLWCSHLSSAFSWATCVFFYQNVIYTRFQWISTTLAVPALITPDAVTLLLPFPKDLCVFLPKVISIRFSDLSLHCGVSTHYPWCSHLPSATCVFLPKCNLYFGTVDLHYTAVPALLPWCSHLSWRPVCFLTKM